MTNQFIGWGWVGTPDGRQQVGKGTPKVADLAHYFDLPSEVGVCLPTPSPETFQHPLFCIFYRAKEQFLGMGHYVAVNEFSSTRKGSHLGSFLLCTENRIPKGQGELVLRLLDGFTKSQYQQVVDPSTSAYKQGVSLYNLSMPQPQELLNQLEANLGTPSPCFKLHNPASKPLVIYYQHGRLPQLINGILEQELFMDFSEVYFTSSLTLAKKFLENHFTVWSAENFDGAHWEWTSVAKPMALKYAQQLHELGVQAQHKLEQQRQEFDARLQQQGREAEQRYNKLKQEAREEVRLYQARLDEQEQEKRQLEVQLQHMQREFSQYLATQGMESSYANSQSREEHDFVTDIDSHEIESSDLKSEDMESSSQGMNWKSIIVTVMLLGVVCIASFALTLLFLL